ncbi:MAG: CCA tRNA nucleotidyltransferase [Clostridium sp.]|jgi:tRNA nucleotidyltransferase (CCA-adding enzyme)|uniref:CCA tRNA nucleotidyltransferase n=1 Tax=Clostridium sp. TaxID=1506 RepID=UPI0025C341D8|nr:CCA tRNA nucleotidyltransferase [Clostridium sp.]MCH3964130.1 CCA tRNA nucleotidyltransferase [Clostridium sp.]MCI1715311.1 CCA tRNA nucleotidyltransferase [Clostridium sp.]MCI1799898.1 CCA tRNA nucleotidyltransferase [Clostridium sp.]MCI1813494.1 CCA tRNA nucleotidyltransferase [Clostridium sp.]MCI1870716.1 CCA tRNA nucleotidyltransferase [Clostridium sp.]
MNILSGFNTGELHIIDIIRETCESKNIEAYIVGGAIRDILMGYRVNDLDICMNENPMVVIKSLCEIESFKYHREFQTASVKFQNGIEIDIIRCRSEIYCKPGMLPVIVPSGIRDDLYRRDFTINSLAYSLNSNELIDLYGGIYDIQAKTIRKIHDNSYEEDPTRIFRALRYASRYGFQIKDRPEINECIHSRVLNTISNDRIIREIYLMAFEKNWKRAFCMLDELNVFKLNLDCIGKTNPLADYDDKNVRILNLFYSIKDVENRQYFIENSILNQDIKKVMCNFKDDNGKIEEDLKCTVDNYSIFLSLKNMNSYCLAYLTWNYRVVYKIYNYIDNLQKCSLCTNGNDIKLLGINDGKYIGKILKYIMKVKLNTGIEIVLDAGEIENVFKHKNKKF